jgi:hypothetical protein
VGSPTGYTIIDAAAAERILEAGNPRGAVARCEEVWREGPNPAAAVVAARAHVILGNDEAALAWVSAAVDTSFDDLDTLSRLNSADELGRLRGHPVFVAALDRLR